jgi:hypothetical protein
MTDLQRDGNRDVSRHPVFVWLHPEIMCVDRGEPAREQEQQQRR